MLKLASTLLHTRMYLRDKYACALLDKHRKAMATKVSSSILMSIALCACVCGKHGVETKLKLVCAQFDFR